MTRRLEIISDVVLFCLSDGAYLLVEQRVLLFFSVHILADSCTLIFSMSLVSYRARLIKSALRLLIVMNVLGSPKLWLRLKISIASSSA